MMENAPLVDQEGYLNLPQAPGLGVATNKAMLM
jgi:L-alanine-DL-glutamate epimerase-like enolase superfamily enzyme